MKAAHLELQPHEAAELSDVLRTPRDLTSDSDVAFWTARFAEAGALELVAARARKLIEELKNDEVLIAAPALSRLVLSIAAWCYQVVEAAQVHSIPLNNREAV